MEVSNLEASPRTTTLLKHMLQVGMLESSDDPNSWRERKLRAGSAKPD
jgi:hypothetical protein